MRGLEISGWHAISLARHAVRPLPLLFLGEILLHIFRLWDDKPLTVDHAERVKAAILPPVHALLDKIAIDPDAPAMGELEQLAASFLSVNMGVIL